jgi:thioesterase domain-containing protein
VAGHHGGSSGQTYQSFDEMDGEVFQELVRRAVKEYHLTPLESKAVLFRARDSHRAHLHGIDPWLGWKGLFTQGIDVVETPGDHSTMLLRENLPPLARQMVGYLDVVMADSEAVPEAER